MVFHIRIPLRAALAGTLMAARQAWRSRRRRAADYRAFQALDDRTLRDLAVCRGEFESLRAEAEGRIERTRLRVAHAPAAKEPS